MNIPVALISALTGAIFGSGVVWSTLKRHNRDLNGLGAKIGRLEKEHIVLLMTFVPENQRKWLAEILLRK